MKGLVTYINETIDSNNVKYLGYSMEEMIADYNILDNYPTMVQKKDIALKYGIDLMSQRRQNFRVSLLHL